jgi:hypothetical protein
VAKVAQDSLDAVARGLVQGLTEDGSRGLSATRRSEIEDEVYGLLDQVGGQMIQALFERQAEQGRRLDCRWRIGSKGTGLAQGG